MATTATSPKIIVIGDVKGQIRSLFTKLAALQAKQNFTFALVAGDLFAEDNAEVTDLLDGKVTVPLTTYFTVGLSPLPQSIIDRLSKDEEICENLHFLKKRSITKTSEGIKIVTLGGKLDVEGDAVLDSAADEFRSCHRVGDARALHGANSADILLTPSWPASVRRGSKIALPDGLIDPAGYNHISDLCAQLKPRYHFTASDFFYEREPFFHTPDPDTPDARLITRFISLAPFGNKEKQKALYAFNLQTNVDPLAPLPSGATGSPFTSRVPRGTKRARLDPEPYSRYAGDHGHHVKGGKRRRGPPPGPGECFFCLSNPNISTHLISSIGDDSYLTTAKGPLTTSSTNSANGIDFPAHALIIPLSHSPTLALMPETEKAKTFTEMNKFKATLQEMIAEKSNNKLGAVTYEISNAGGVHIHWQLLPVPEALIRRGLVEAAFKVEAENHEYPKFQTRDPGIGQDEGDFFRVWIWTPPSEDEVEGSTKCIIMPFDESIRFNLQFGRIVLAKLLGLEKRQQWKESTQSEEEEKAEIALFKAAYKTHDFTL